MIDINRSIFITNTFAQLHPREHIFLWDMFQKQVPAAKRRGYYGAENVAYINWLKNRKDKVFVDFIHEEIPPLSLRR
jgi:hypothetical protein